MIPAFLIAFLAIIKIPHFLSVKSKAKTVYQNNIQLFHRYHHSNLQQSVFEQYCERNMIMIVRGRSTLMLRRVCMIIQIENSPMRIKFNRFL